MAGRPKHKRDLVALSTMPVKQITAMLESAKSMADICMELKVSRSAIEEWLAKPEQEGLLARARARAADDIVSATIAIADTEPVEESQKTRLRIQTRQWVAERWNAPAYAQNKGQNVSISIAGLRLDALRHVEIVEQPEQIRGTNRGTDGDA